MTVTTVGGFATGLRGPKLKEGRFVSIVEVRKESKRIVTVSRYCCVVRASWLSGTFRWCLVVWNVPVVSVGVWLCRLNVALNVWSCLFVCGCAD